METTLLRLCDPRLDTTPESLLRRIEALETRPVSAGVPAGAAAVPATVAAPAAPAADVPKATVPAEPSAPVHEVPAAAEPAPFAGWVDVLDYIAKQSPPLYGVLADSTAMIDGEQLVILTDNELFVSLVNSAGNKAVLMGAVQAVVGKPMRIKRGRSQQSTAQEATDPLSAFLKRSAESGVVIEEKG